MENSKFVIVSLWEVPYFPINNAHLMYTTPQYFSVLMNFYRDRAPENT
jgi:hypothetical protein